MKRLVFGFIFLLIIIPVGAWLYFVLAVKVNIEPGGGEEATVPLALARVEMKMPASWRVASYRTDLIFDKNATGPRSSRQVTLNELGLDESYDQQGNFNPNLFPEYQTRSLSHVEEGLLQAPEGLNRPFIGLILVGKYDKQINYVAAMDMEGFLLHLTIDLAWPKEAASLSLEQHNRLFAEQLAKVFEIYEAKPELEEATDLRTRFGRIRQNPADYFVKQTIHLRSAEEDFNFGATILTKGDCGPGREYKLCAGLDQFFEPYKQLGSFKARLIDLISGYHEQILEAGEKKVNGLEVYDLDYIRYNILPWGFDGDWHSLVTSRNVFPGPAINNTGAILMACSSEDMAGKGGLQERFNHHHGTIMNIWSSMRPI